MNFYRAAIRSSISDELYGPILDGERITALRNYHLLTDLLLKLNVRNFWLATLVDRGYQGRSNVCGVEIMAPHRKKKTGSYYQKRKDGLRFARRSAIEPVIGHLKNDFRMARCFLKGALVASQNLMLAAAAWNLKKWMNESSFWLNFVRLLGTLANVFRTVHSTNLQLQCLSVGF